MLTTVDGGGMHPQASQKQCAGPHPSHRSTGGGGVFSPSDALPPHRSFNVFNVRALFPGFLLSKKSLEVWIVRRLFWCWVKVCRESLGLKRIVSICEDLFRSASGSSSAGHV